VNEKREYVVVTRFQRTEKSRPIVHTYGPYGQVKAKSVKSNMRAEAQRLGYISRFEVSVCHMIDVEQMDRDAAANIVRGTICK
jgi:IMP cyclohydrolase